MNTLPIASTLLATVRQIVAKRKVLLRALLFPMVVSSASWSLLWHVTEIGHVMPTWIFVSIVASLVASALAAVTCHRVVLRGSASLRNRWGVHLGDREFAFMGRSLLIGAIGIVPSFAAQYWVAQHWIGGIQPISDELCMRAVYMTGWLVPAYPISRLSLVLPATAINRPIAFRAAWGASRGNGWRLACVLYLPPLALMVGGTIWDAIVPDIQHAAYVGATSAVTFLLGVFEIVALSCAYRTLVEEQTNPS